jgi:hypothetical protein
LGGKKMGKSELIAYRFLIKENNRKKRSGRYYLASDMAI